MYKYDRYDWLAPALADWLTHTLPLQKFSLDASHSTQQNVCYVHNYGSMRPNDDRHHGLHIE